MRDTKRLWICLALLGGAMWLAVAGCQSSGKAPRHRWRGGEDAGMSLLPVPKGPGLYRDLRQHTFTMEGIDNSPDMRFDGAMLAYSSTFNAVNPDVYLKAPNGTAVQQLTTSPASDTMPKFSPDGKRVAFCSDRNGNWDIFVVKASSPGTVWQITRSEDDDIHPAWSHDGKKIVYCSRRPNESWELWIVDLATLAVTNLGPGMFPEWSPAGDRIVFQKPRYRGEFWYGVWAVDPDGQNLTEMVPNDHWAAINPSWSPDGKRIAFATVHKSPLSREEERIMEADDVWVANADGSGLYQLTSEDTPEWAPRWGADGRIYFVSRRMDRQNIWSVDPILPEVLTRGN